MNFLLKLKFSIKTIVLYVLILTSASLIFSCCSGNKSTKTSNTVLKQKKSKYFELLKPTDNQIIHQDSSFLISLSGIENLVPDSISVSNNEGRIVTTRIDSLNFSAFVGSNFVGNQAYNIGAYFADSISEKYVLNLFVLPNTIPIEYTYKILRTFNHDPMAYTQGLIFTNGHLYESTGRKKQSSLRRLNVETGEIVHKKDLEPEFFGEGIALVGKEIYMITYTSQVGFVYDAVTFELIRKFDLQTREGWGLTSYGSELILSDGSASLFFFEPKYFSLIKQIEVCDNNGLISNLNELEYTPYGLFANIYGENYIVLVDQNTGVVKGKIDLSGLFPKEVPDNYDYVLNGIAFNPDSKTFYVTGKQWPVIYEIKINLD